MNLEFRDNWGKSSIFVENLRKIWIFLKFYEKYKICSKFPEKSVDFGQNLKKKSILVKFFENLNFDKVIEIFLKITILVKIIKNLAL